MPLETPTTTARKTSAKLAALTGMVLLAHGGLLYGTPVSLVSSTPESAAFSTRMISMPSAMPVAPAVQVPVPRTPSLQTPPLVAPRPHAAVRPQFEAPAALQASGESAAEERTVAGPGPDPAVPENTYGAISQLLAADDLKAAAAQVLLSAADEQPSTSPAAPAPARAASAKSTQVFSFPPSIHLKYKTNGEVKGFAYYVNGDLQWKQDGKTYSARLEVSHFLLGSRVQTSRGELGATGLEPIRFGDKVRSERAAHFERSKGKVSFSANTPDAPLVPGTQDQLSTLLQLGAMLGGSPASFPEGTLVPFESVGPESVESWVFKVGPQEKLTLPGGQVSAIKLVREAVGDYGTRGEVWLAPSMGYLPVRIRLIESNGNFVDQKWSDTVTP